MDYIQDRKLKIRLLRSAHKRMLSVAGPNHICAALIASEYHSYGRLSEVYRASGELQTYVMNALSPHVYYSRWLKDIDPWLYNKYGFQGCRQGRIAWINWMIACYEEDIANYKEPQ